MPKKRNNFLARLEERCQAAHRKAKSERRSEEQAAANPRPEQESTVDRVIFHNARSKRRPWK